MNMRKWLRGRASPCQGEGREFESRLPLHFAQIAQLVEQGTENPRVLGSIPSLGTMKSCFSGSSFFFQKQTMMKQKNDPGKIDRDNGNNTPLADEVNQYKNGNRISFHVPGHKGSGIPEVSPGSFCPDVLRSDLTELPGLDDLCHPTGVIAEAERLASELFGAEETFFLVNGTTSGVAAAIAAVSSERDTVILERHSHESTTRGLVLSGASPCYIYNAYDEETGLFSGITPSEVKEAIRKCSSPAAVVLTHPSYYGTYSDLRGIVETAHQAGVVVIVDEAHGAQLAFTEQQGIPPALSTGADLVIQSTHKMLGSLTQSSMLHVQGALVDRNRLHYYISFMNSTSPSYLLMSSLDLTRAFMEKRGREIWKTIRAAVETARDQLNRTDGVSCPVHFRDADGRKHRLESSRLLISMWEHGLTGAELGRILSENYSVDVEFSDLQYAVALVGTGSTEEDVEDLVRAIRDISSLPGKTIDPAAALQIEQYCKVSRIRPKTGMTPRQALAAKTLRLGGVYAEGMVSARDVSLYPPGIPVIRTGEVFSREIIDYVEENSRSGMEFHGTAGTGESGETCFFCAEDPMAMDLMNGFF